MSAKEEIVVADDRTYKFSWENEETRGNSSFFSLNFCSSRIIKEFLLIQMRWEPFFFCFKHTRKQRRIVSERYIKRRGKKKNNETWTTSGAAKLSGPTFQSKLGRRLVFSYYTIRSPSKKITSSSIPTNVNNSRKIKFISIYFSKIYMLYLEWSRCCPAIKSSCCPFFFQRTCGSGWPRGGSHSKVADSPRIPLVAKGTVRNSGCKSRRKSSVKS